MTSTDLVVQSTAYSRANLTERQQYVAMLARAGDLLPPHLRGGMERGADGRMALVGNAGKTFLLAETGDMLGIHPMAAMTGVHIIEGKPSLSANLMSGLVRKAGHRLRVKVTGRLEDESLSATAWLKRVDDDEFEFEVTWTIAKAKRALLYPGKAASNWQKYPDAMLKARAVAEIIREGASDVLMGGNIYTPEELGATVNEEGEPVNLEATREPAPAAPTPTAAPVVDEPEASQVGTEDFDWKNAIEEAPDAQSIRVLYQKAKHDGLLNMKIKVGRKNRELGALLVEVGKALADAEAAAETEAEPAEPAEEVVVAEIVDEDPDAEAVAAHEAQYEADNRA